MFREPIICSNIPRYVPGWTKPIVIGRHAHGDQYKATDLKIPGPGTVTLTYTPDWGEPESTRSPGSTAVASPWACTTTTTRSATSPAPRCATGSTAVHPVYLSTKNTILKAYDGQFKDIFQDVYDNEFSAKEFKEAGIRYEHRLIDDMVAQVIKGDGGYVWACKNYDGDVQSNTVAQGFGSPRAHDVGPAHARW